MHKKIIRIKNLLSALPLPLYVCIGILSLLCVSAIFCFVMTEMPQETDYGNTLSIIIIATVFAPLIETFAFQFLPIEVSQYVLRDKYKKKSVPISIAVSAILFSLMHSQSVSYMLYAFAMGIILALLYYIKSGKGFIRPFVATWLIHLSWNLIAILF